MFFFTRKACPDSMRINGGIWMWIREEHFTLIIFSTCFGAFRHHQKSNSVGKAMNNFTTIHNEWIFDQLDVCLKFRCSGGSSGSCCEFCHDSWSDPCLLSCRWSSTSSSWSSTSVPLGLAPFVMRFLNQDAWNLGTPVFEFAGDSGADPLLEVTPTRNLYATLLADTISVLACLNCN